MYSGGARHSNLTSAPGWLASGRAVPSTSSHQSTAQSIALLAVDEKKEEGEAETSRRGSKRTTMLGRSGGL